ncbi:DUF6163 family protein [Martelella soudanensis]|uniref:DUF6163 family protein n=1 Tax=Martelella sp. NC18 TaxID=2740297 RepID=UPI0015DDD11C|nr:DUF6163 family protein [Martelella sp. NC18]
MNSEQKRPPQPSFSQMAFTVFKRCVAAFLLVIALYNWAELIGLAGDGTGRFDLVSSNQRIVEVVLAVAYPAAAAGLWFGVGWGLVLWAIGAAVEMSLAGPPPRSSVFTFCCLASTALSGFTLLSFVGARIAALWCRVRFETRQ